MAKCCRNCLHFFDESKTSPCRKCDVITQKFEADHRYTRWEPNEKHLSLHPEEYSEKEEKKMDNRKTKAQLIEELEQKNAEIKELKEEIKRSENFEQGMSFGKDVREMLNGMVAGGLTEDQAFQIFMMAAGAMCPTLFRK